MPKKTIITILFALVLTRSAGPLMHYRVLSSYWNRISL